MIDDLEIIYDWLKFNKLSLNMSKSSFIFISKQSIKVSKDPLILNGNKINYSNSIRFLGLYIDECLTWEIHINKVKEKILPYVGILSKLRHYLVLRYLKLIYFCFIYSHLQYLTSVWGTACKNHLNKLKVLQNKAIKFIYKLPHLEPTINLYTPKNFLNINNLYRYKICCYIFSVIKKKKHSNITFTNNSTIHRHHTRQTNSLFLINVNSNFGKKSVHFRGIQTFNKLPDSLKLLESMTKFKNELKCFLINIQKDN